MIMGDTTNDIIVILRSSIRTCCCCCLCCRKHLLVGVLVLIGIDRIVIGAVSTVADLVGILNIILRSSISSSILSSILSSSSIDRFEYILYGKCGWYIASDTQKMLQR